MTAYYTKDKSSPERQHVAWIADDADLVGDEALGRRFREIHSIANPAGLEVQMHDALAPRVAYVTEEGIFGQRSLATSETSGRAVEMPVEQDVVAQATSLAQGVLGDDGRAEELAHEEDLGVAFLVLERRQVNFGTARGREIDPPV